MARPVNCKSTTKLWRETSALWLISLLAMTLGCGPISRPWAGEMYRPPSRLENPARRMDKHTPTILPPRRAPRLSPEEQDAEIERMLFGGLAPKLDAGDLDDLLK